MTIELLVLNGIFILLENNNLGANKEHTNKAKVSQQGNFFLKNRCARIQARLPSKLCQNGLYLLPLTYIGTTFHPSSGSSTLQSDIIG